MRFSVVAVAVAGVFLLPIALASAQGVNDAQIASIVVTANQVDIDAGSSLPHGRRLTKSKPLRG